jgi:ABC-type transporter Mla subunit MlaD
VSRIETITGAFLAAVLFLLIVALFASVRRTSVVDMFRAGFVITAMAPDGYGAAIGSPVKVRDVEVGSVTEVTLIDEPRWPDRPVRIRMQIQPAAARFLGEKTVAHIVRPPFGSGMPPFGTSSIDLMSQGGPPLANASTILAEGEDSMISTFTKLRGDVQAIREQFVATLGDLSATLANMRKLTDTIVQGKGMIGRALYDDAAAETLTRMLHTAGDATEDLRRVAADMKTAAGQAPELASGARETSEELRKVLAHADQVLDAVPRIVATVERTLQAAEELVKELRAASSYAPELARKADVSLEETNRLVEAAQKNFLLRSSMPDRPTLRTESEVRPRLAAEPRETEPKTPRDAGSP